jgi:uridine kinase
MAWQRSPVRARLAPLSFLCRASADRNCFGAALADKMKSSIDDIVQAVRMRPAPDGMRTKIVAIDGCGGAGKTALASRLAEALGNAQVLHTDDFASWDNPIDWWPRLIREALEPLGRNEPARFRATDWENSGRQEWREIEPAEFVILEGVSASREAFQPFLTYPIWVETPRELRLRSGLERDGAEARAQWESWMAEEDEYVNQQPLRAGAPHRPGRASRRSGR